jgi:acyl-homoserine lactone acylase PvdQ
MRIVLLALLAGLVLAAPASAQLGGGSGPPVPRYQDADGQGFRDVLPPGTRGHYSAIDLVNYLTTGQNVPHCCDQLEMYNSLVYATPGLAAGEIGDFFKDSSFGVKEEDRGRTYSPRADVTIVRDRGYGVPHVYGRDRDGAMFGLGYVGAEDRLFLMDVLRHAGRAELSSFAGGSNTAMDAEQWAVAPYTEADLTRQAEQLPRFLGPQGEIIRRDVDNYVAGVNQYISEARLDPAKMPGEYAAIARPQGPDPWRREDLIATASLVGGIFGKGGGEELAWTTVADALDARFGAGMGAEVFDDFRSAEDPEAPVTVKRTRFPYQRTPREIRADSVARPDAGSLRPTEVASGDGGGGVPIIGRLPFSASNALLVSARKSATGRPLMVAGPQVSYFQPQILMEEDVHAPASGDLPGIDARGASFAGVNLYVQLGRGRDYAWSATSAGQDNIDTFAVELCEPGGGAATIDSAHYLFRGECLPMEVLEKTNSWTPNPGDPTPAGTQRLRAERTKLGLVAARGTVDGRPVAFTKLRSTYFHEVDSAAGFMDFNDPGAVRDPDSFMRAAHKIGYTFNWHYVDPEHIAYFNSGANPVRARGLDHDFPVRGTAENEWRDWDPEGWTSRVTGFARHPQVVDQGILIQWNNKQARGYRGPDENVFSSVYRSVMLERRVKRELSRRKMTMARLVDIMEIAGSGDLRAESVLRPALRIIGTPSDPALRDAVAKLDAWKRDGGLRRDYERDGTYEHADAIRIMDAWWPLWVRAQYEPALGRDAFRALVNTTAIDNPPNNRGDHVGSAYQGAFFGYVKKDLRTILGRDVRGRYAQRYCGGGSLAGCREMLSDTLREAIAVPAGELYGGDEVCRDEGMDGSQWCFDAIRFRPVGGAEQPLIHWINRPTYQQVVEVIHRVPRP